MLLKLKDKIIKNYDVIVIGGGLGGMTAANRLAKVGKSVLLLEAHNKLGGFATWFKRDNNSLIFDISLHGFPYGMVKTCKKYWNKEIADSIVQLKGLRFVNPNYDLTSDFTMLDFVAKLIHHFRVDEVKVREFFSYLESGDLLKTPAVTNRELFDRFFPKRDDLVRFLLEPISYANGSTLDEPALTYGIVFMNFMNKGVYTFKGGTDQFIAKCQEELLKNGVDIKFHSEVQSIAIENNVAIGVYLKDELIRSKSVLSNGNILKTIEMAKGAKLSHDFVNKREHVKLNTSSCQVYMGLKKGETIPHVGDLIFHSHQKDFTPEGLLSKEVLSQTFSIYYPDIRPDIDARTVIVSSSNARYSDWVNLSKEEYKERKEFLIKRALDTIEEIIPGVSQKIDYLEAATPLTLQKYTRHPQGTSFGTKYEGLYISQNLHKEIRGLFHTGSVGIIMSGWLGAANYGVIQSYEVESFLENNKEEVCQSH